MCFVCEAPVAKAGEACSQKCYAHFLVAVIQQPGPVEMENLVAFSAMPWYVEQDET